MALAKLGREKEAISRFSEAIRQNPNHGDAHYEIGKAMLRYGNAALAIPQFRAAVRQHPNDVEAIRHLAVALSLTGQIQEAITRYKDALNFRPEYTEAKVGLAWILATTPDSRFRDPAAALRLAQNVYDQGIHLTPQYLDALATAQAAMGQYELAVKTEQSAIDADAHSKNPNSQKQLEARLKLFQEGHPYVEPVNPTTKPAATAPAAP